MMAPPKFAEVKAKLDESMEKWRVQNGREARMRAAHLGPVGWDSKDELLDSAPYGLALIGPDLIGNGKAEETNLVKILRRSIGGYRRMPSRGPYLEKEDIDLIAEWINSGCPD